MLNDAALVLNRSWYPIGTTTVRTAICMIYRAAARAFDPEACQTHDFDSWASLQVPDGDPCIRTVRLRIKVPEVIVLTNYEALPDRRVPFSRRNIYRRDHNSCQYCGIRPKVADLTIDHVLPRSRGGVSSWDNCVLACLACNRRKANRTLRESGMRLVQVPKEPHWTPIITIPITQRKASWEQFVSERYWTVELEA